MNFSYWISTTRNGNQDSPSEMLYHVPYTEKCDEDARNLVLFVYLHHLRFSSRLLLDKQIHSVYLRVSTELSAASSGIDLRCRKFLITILIKSDVDESKEMKVLVES